MKIYISADIEGTVGVLDGTECTMGNPEYERARRFMTREVDAATRGALKNGATEVVVKDAHSTGRNLLIDELPEEVEVVRGWSGHPFKMMQELDPSFDGVIFLGYHGGANSRGNNLAHTIHGKVVEEIRINDMPASEFMINTYTASYVGVPVIFVSGDRNLIEDEVKELNLGIESISPKLGKGGSIITMTPKRATQLIEQGVAEAIKNIGIISTLELPEKFKLEIDFTKEAYAERSSYYPNMKRIKTNTVEGTFTDYFDLLTALLFLLKD